MKSTAVTQSIIVEQYEITIKRTVRRVVKMQVHDVIDKRPYTDGELEEANQYFRDNTDRSERIKEITGWAEAVEDEKEETEEVYRQTVNELDMYAVINAINHQKSVLDA